MTRLALQQRRALCDELAGRGLDAQAVIVSDDENLELADEFGFATVEMDNQHLGRRFNAGYRYACENGADYVVHIGSDDWIHPDCFDRLDELAPLDEMPLPTREQPVVVFDLKSDPMLVGSEMLVVDLASGTGTVIRPTGPYGVVPWVLPARAFEASGFAPLPDEQPRGIDGALVRGLEALPRPIFDDPCPCARVDFKSDVNITPYKALTHIGEEEPDPWGALDAHYPADLVAQARALSVEMAYAC